MSKIMKRTPVAGTKDVTKIGRPSKLRHTEMYSKHINLVLVGSSREEIQSVAASMHKAIAIHEAVTGGKKVKKVHVMHNSTDPIKIFDGCISTNSI